VKVGRQSDKEIQKAEMEQRTAKGEKRRRMKSKKQGGGKTKQGRDYKQQRRKKEITNETRRQPKHEEAMTKINKGE
jgi:hypothetical protein